MKKTQGELNEALLEAALTDDFEEAKKLIAKGANVNTVHITGSTPLLLFGWGHKALQSVPYLLKRGANAQAKYRSETLLEWAERQRQTTLAAILREHIAKLEEKPENPLRFKTEAEFVKEFGEGWRHTGDKKWNKDGEMDYLFGLPCKPEWVDGAQEMHPDKCPHGVHTWSVQRWMVTTDPLPQEQLTETSIPFKTRAELDAEHGPLSHKTVREWIDTLPSPVREATLPLLSEDDLNHLVPSLSEAMSLCATPKPPLRERYPVGSKIKIQIEAEVGVWVHGDTLDLHARICNSDWHFHFDSKFFKIIED